MSEINKYLLLIIPITSAYILTFYLIVNSEKKILSKLLDTEFSKVQSFHKKPILKVGGILIYFYTLVSFLVFRDLSLLKDILFIFTPIFFFHF